MKFKSLPPIKNPQTEAMCQAIAKRYRESTLSEILRKQEARSVLVKWWQDNPQIGHWEYQAVIDRIYSLIVDPEC
ncbi:hypothetical protein MWH03_00575 [Klebsiella pneumoniae]|nr:hypothetical protein [Klebsiella pneumoniae]